jgi:hypothetical protein
MMQLFRIKTISDIHGADDNSPFYPTIELARQMAQVMLTIHQGKTTVEIYQMLDAQLHKRRLVEIVSSHQKL